MKTKGSKHITEKEIIKVWNLHKSNCKTSLICETLGLSRPSVCRIINIMEAAKSGGDVDGLYGGGSKKIKTYAKNFFGIAQQTEEKAEEKTTETPVEADSLKEFAVRVLFELHHTNKLLERLCRAWGAEEDGD